MRSHRSHFIPFQNILLRGSKTSKSFNRPVRHSGEGLLNSISTNFCNSNGGMENGLQCAGMFSREGGGREEAEGSHRHSQSMASDQPNEKERNKLQVIIESDECIYVRRLR